MRIELLWILLTAVFWGGYPLVARAAGHAGPRGTLILMLAGMVPITLVAAFFDPGGWPARPALLKLLGAGLMMGGGLLAFYALAAGEMDASVSIPIVDVAMLIVTAVGAMWFFDEPVTAKKLVGIALMVGGIGLLHPS